MNVKIKMLFLWIAILFAPALEALGKTLTYTLQDDLDAITLTRDPNGYAHFPRGVLDFPYGPAGAPALRAKTVLFAVPDGCTVGDVAVAADWTPIATDVLLYPMQEPTRTSDTAVFTPPNPAYYGATPFPVASHEVLPIAIASGVKMQPVNVVPFRYDAAARTLYAASTYTVTVTLDEIPASGPALLPTASATPKYSQTLRAMVSDMVVNSDDVDTTSTTTSPSLLPTAGGPLPTSGVVSGATLPITGTVPDYVMISPSAFVSAWTTYVDTRAAKFPSLTFAVVNADTIYSSYSGRNDMERIHAFIKDQASRGTTYFVLGGQARRQDWGSDKVNALGQVIDRSNSIPTCLNASCEGSNWMPSDMYFACHDIKAGTYAWDSNGDLTYLGNTETTATVDLVPDCVVTRISVMPYNYDGTGVKTAAQLIAAYTDKLAEGESLGFAGRFKYAVGGSSLNYNSYYHEDGAVRTGEHEFHDESPNFYDTRRGAWIDCERQMRNRVPQYMTLNRPVLGGTTIFGGGVWDPDSANTDEARREWFRTDWECIDVDGHGWAMGTSGFDASENYTSPTAYNVRCATGLTKFYLFLSPCDTGYLDYYNGKSIPCLGESSVNNPVGGSLFSVHNSRYGWFSDSMNEDGLSSRLEGLMLKYLFTQNNDAGTAVKNMRAEYGAGLGGISGNRGLDCLIEETPMGDPLVRITPVYNMTWAGATSGSGTWSTASANWNSSNGSNGVGYESGNGTTLTLTGSMSLAMSEKLSTMNLVVNQPAGSTFAMTGAGSFKVTNGVTVSAGNLSYGVGGGVGLNGISFTSKGNLTLSGSTYCYVAKVTNAGAVVVSGANTVFDLADRTSHGFDTLSYSGVGVATSVNNILRSRTSGSLASFAGPIPVTNSDLVLQTYNIGGTGTSTSTLFNATNSRITVKFNPGWDSEYFNRPLTLNCSTLRNEYKYFALGNSALAGFDLNVTGSGTSTLEASSTDLGAPLNGTLRVTADAGATLNVTTVLKNGPSGAGAINKLGAGTMTISGHNTYTGGTTVTAGTLRVTTADGLGTGAVVVKSGATLELTAIPLTGVTSLTVESGAKLILPDDNGLGYFQVLGQGGTTFVVSGSVCEDTAPTTALTGHATNLGAFVLTSSQLIWMGDANSDGTWSTNSSYKPWNTTPAAFANGNIVLFGNRGADATAAVTVLGAVSTDMAIFENTTTAYTFLLGTGGSVDLALLQTCGPVTFAAPVVADNGVIVTGGALTMATLKTPTVEVQSGATFGASSLSGNGFKYIKFEITGVVTSGEKPAVAEFRLFQGGSIYNWPVGTILADSAGASVTKTVAAYPGQVGTSNEQQPGCLIDGYFGTATTPTIYGSGSPKFNKWWPTADGTSPWHFIIQLPANVTGVTGYNLCAADHNPRSATAWTVSVSNDGVNWTQVDAQTGRTSSVNSWYNGNGAVAAYAFSNPGSVVDVQSGATLVAKGAYSAWMDLALGSTLKGVSDGTGLVLGSGSTLNLYGSSGTVFVDTSAMSSLATPQPVLTAPNLTSDDIVHFSSNTADAVLSISGNTLYATTDGFAAPPYTRSLSGAANWNTTAWSGNGAAFTSPWSSTVTDANGATTVTLTAASTLTVDTPVRVGAFTATGGAYDFTLALGGANTFAASSYNFTGITGASTVSFNTGSDSVTCGTNTIVAGGSGALTIASGKKGTITAPWTGTISNSGTLVYSGTQTGVTPMNTGTVQLDTEMSFGGFTWNGGTLTLTPNANVTIGGDLTLAANKSLVVNGGTLTANTFFPSGDSSSASITINNGAQVTFSTLRPGWYNPSINYNISGAGTRLKVGVLGGDNNMFNGVYPTFNISGGAELSLGANIAVSGNGIGIANLRFDGGVLSAYANWGFSTTETLNNRIVDGSTLTLDPASYTITYSQVIGETASSSGGGQLIVGRTGATGTLVLSNDNTYSRGTTVAFGTLKLTNTAGSATGSGMVTVNSGATLTGTGIVTGGAMVNGNLLPGDGGIGTLNLNGAVTLGSTSVTTIEINKAGTTLTCDKISGAGAITYGGTLTVTATGDALAAGDSFQIFPKGSFGGAFATLNLPTLGSGRSWSVSDLFTTGTISVVASTTTPGAVTGGATNIATTSATLNGMAIANGFNTTVTFEYGLTTSYGLTMAATPSPVTGSVWTPVSAALTGLDSGSTYHFRVKTVSSKGTTYGGDMSFTTALLIGNGTWSTAAGGSWPTGANWIASVIGSGVDNTADFSTLDLTADATVTLDGARTIGNLVFGDTTPSHNWIVSTGTGGPLTLAVTSGNPTVTVNNQTATLGVVLGGSRGLAKAGSGTLVLSGSNTYTGGTVINGGVLELASSGKLYNGGWNNGDSITVNAGATWRLPDYTYGGVGQLADYADRRVLNGGTIEVTGATQSSGQDFRVNATGGTFRYAPAVTTNTLTLSGNGNSNIPIAGALTFDAVGNITVTEIIEGAGSLAKTGTGTLSLEGATNSFAGNVTVGAGTLQTASAMCNGATSYLGAVNGSRTITVSSGATLLMRGNNNFGGSGKTAAGLPSIVVDGGTLNANRFNILGDLTLNGATLVQSSSDSGNYEGWQFLGSITVGGSTASTIGSGNGKANHLRGAATTTFSVADAAAGVDLLVSNVLRDGSGDYAGAGALLKTGAGTMQLAAANTYTGTTTVDAGTLLVTGSLASPSTTVASGAQLGGTGTLSGTVSVDGILAPGTTATGTLTLGATTLNATGILSVDMIGNASTAGTDFDRIVTSSCTSAAGSSVNLVFNGSGSAVDFTNAFWTTAQRFKVVSTTSAVTAAPALGTVSTDSLGQACTDYGAFSVAIASDTLGIEVVWTPVVAQTPIQTWRETWFGTAENSGGAANDADPDKDGRSNLLEYAIGANPTVADAKTGISSKVMVSSVDGLKHLNAIVSVNAVATDVTVSVEFASSTSGPWTNVMTYTTDAQGRHVYTDPVVATPGSPRFFRVVVTPL